MTPIIHLRSFTDDQYWLDKVFYTNSYRIRGFKIDENRPVVVDIGAHCGYFAFTALSLGAKKVYCVEPFIENYKVLLQNLGDNGAVVTHNLGITDRTGSICFSYPKPEKNHLLFGYPKECSSDSIKTYSAPCTFLDLYLSSFVDEDVIDILKINIGYQERDILISSNLDNVQSVCGETVLEEEHRAAFKAKMSAKGFVKSHIISNTEEENKIFFIFSKTDIEKYYNL